MTDDLKLISFPKRDQEELNNNVVIITYTDNTSEIFKADAFAVVDEMPGCIALWRENPYENLGFVNIQSIRKLEVKENTECLIDVV